MVDNRNTEQNDCRLRCFRLRLCGYRLLLLALLGPAALLVLAVSIPSLLVSVPVLLAKPPRGWKWSQPCSQVRKTPSWPRSWAKFSLL
jgi:hypothetical protein